MSDTDRFNVQNVNIVSTQTGFTVTYDTEPLPGTLALHPLEPYAIIYGTDITDPQGVNVVISRGSPHHITAPSGTYTVAVVSKNILESFSPAFSPASVTVRTDEENDTTPSIVRNASVGSPTQLTIPYSFDAPADNGGAAITGYVVVYKQVGDAQYSVFDDGTNGISTSGTITGLGAGTDYLVNFAAVNSVGQGLYLENDIAVSTLAEVTQPPVSNGPEVALDPPVNTAITGQTQHAFGFDRLVEGYTGNTVTLRRLSDNAAQAFGVTGLGHLDMDAVETWRGSADVDVVSFLDQMVTGNVLDVPANYTVAFIRNDVVGRFGATRSTTDGQLTRSATDGGVGGNLGDDIGCFVSDAVTFDTTGGVELHMLWSQNERKVKSNVVDDFGGNADDEYLFTFGRPDNTNVYFRNVVGAGTAVDFVKAQTQTGQQTSNTHGYSYKKYGQNVRTYSLQPDTLNVYANGRVEIRGLGAANQADIANGVYNGSKLIIGNTFTNTSGGLRTNSMGNILFGGVIVTTPLENSQRYAVQSKLGAIGQQHKVRAQSTIEGYFEEIVDFASADGNTGTIAGKNNLLQLDVNINTVAEGAPDWEFNAEIPGIGVRGLKTGSMNPANGFKATNTYFSGHTSGTMVLMYYSTGSGNNLYQVLSRAAGSQFDQSGEMSLAIGSDHLALSCKTAMASSLDPDNLIGSRLLASESDFLYDGSNQTDGKYNTNTPHTSMVYGEMFNDTTLTEVRWANQDPGAIELDAPVIRPLADNIPYEHKHDALIFNVLTFKAPDGYNRGDDYATRKQFRLQAENHSYVSDGVTPFGHNDGDIAYKQYAAVADGPDNSYIMTQNPNTGTYEPFHGYRIFAAFSPDVLTQEQVEEVQVNLYKLLPPPASQIISAGGNNDATASMSLQDYSGADSQTGMAVFGVAFDEGDIPAGSYPQARLAGGGPDIASGYIHKMTNNAGDLRACFMAVDAGSVTGTQNIEIYAKTGTQDETFNLPAYLAARSDDLMIRITNRTGFTRGALSDLDFSLKAALADSSNVVIEQSSPLLARIKVVQYVAGEDHYHVVWYVSAWLNNGTAKALEVEYRFGAYHEQGVREGIDYDLDFTDGSATIQTFSTTTTHPYFTAFVGVRMDDDAGHAKPHWINEDGNTPMPTLLTTYSLETNKKLARTSFGPALNWEGSGTGAIYATTFTQFAKNGLRGGNGTGGYQERPWFTNSDCTAAFLQTEQALRAGRVCALGTWCFKHVRDLNTKKDTLIPGPFIQINNGVQSYTGLGETRFVVEGSISNPGGSYNNIGNFDNGVTGPDVPLLFGDDAHASQPAAYYAFREGRLMLVDAAIGKFDMGLRDKNANELGHSPRNPYSIYTPERDSLGLSGAKYGVMHMLTEQERSHGASIFASASNLMTDDYSERPYFDNFATNMADFVDSIVTTLPQKQKDGGGGFKSKRPTDSLWMQCFTAAGFYRSSQVERQRGNVANADKLLQAGDQAMAVAKRMVDAGDFGKMYAYRANLYGEHSMDFRTDHTDTVLMLSSAAIDSATNRVSIVQSSSVTVPILSDGDLVFFSNMNENYVSKPLPDGVTINQKMYARNAAYAGGQTSIELYDAPTGGSRIAFTQDVSMGNTAIGYDSSYYSTTNWLGGVSDSFAHIHYATMCLGKLAGSTLISDTQLAALKTWAVGGQGDYGDYIGWMYEYDQLPA